MTGTIRILGVDPGLRRTGWGVIDVQGSRLAGVACGVIAPDSSAALSDRLRALDLGIEAVIAEHAPAEAAIEEAFMAANASSALKLGHARAASMLAAARAGLSVAEYAARLVKKSVVGTGGAEKAQVASMISILLPGMKADGDAADALAVAICHAHHRRASSLGSAA